MMDVDYGIGRGIDADADADMGEMNFVFLYDAVVAVKRYLSRSYYYDSVSYTHLIYIFCIIL